MRKIFNFQFSIFKTLRRPIFYFLFSIFLLAPFVVSAAVPSLWPTGFWGPLVSCTGNYLNKDLGSSSPIKPCTSLCDVLQTTINIIYFGMSLAIFVIAPIGIAWGGVLILMSGANEGWLLRGKEILKFTVIGIVVILASFLIVSTLIQVMGVKSGLVQGFGSDFVCNVPVGSAPGFTGGVPAGGGGAGGGDQSGTAYYICNASGQAVSNPYYNDPTCGGDVLSDETCAQTCSASGGGGGAGGGGTTAGGPGSSCTTNDDCQSGLSCIPPYADGTCQQSGGGASSQYVICSGGTVVGGPYNSQDTCKSELQGLGSGYPGECQQGTSCQ